MLIGSDVECFVKSRDTGEVLAACGMLEGSKGSPFSLGDGYGVQEDNVTVEFNVPPAKTSQEFYDILIEGRNRVREYVAGRFSGPTDLAFTSAATLRADQLKHPLAKQFGCVPELDAYGMGNSFPCPKIGTTRTRFAGFHLHFGFKDEKELAVPGFVAVTLLEALLHNYGKDRIVDDTHSAGGLARKKFYGKPGAYRDTAYPGGYFGFEYRCMGAGAFNELKLVVDSLDSIWESLERVCADRVLAARVYRELDLVALRNREFSMRNQNLVTREVYDK